MCPVTAPDHQRPDHVRQMGIAARDESALHACPEPAGRGGTTASVHRLTCFLGSGLWLMCASSVEEPRCLFLFGAIQNGTVAFLLWGHGFFTASPLRSDSPGVEGTSNIGLPGNGDA